MQKNFRLSINKTDLKTEPSIASPLGEKKNRIYIKKLFINENEPSQQETLRSKKQTSSGFIKNNSFMNGSLSKSQIRSSNKPENFQKKFIFQNSIHPRKQIIQKPVISINEMYLKKLDINILEFENTLKPIVAQMNDLFIQIKNKQALYKVINKILTDNFIQSIKLFFIDWEKNELFESCTLEGLKNKLQQKSFTLYQLLLKDLKENNNYKSLKPFSCLLKQFNIFHKKLLELNEQRKEEKMNIMKGNIIMEWQQINEIMKSSRKLRFYFQYEKAKLYPLSISHFPLKSPADEVQMKELAYGKFPKISMQERRFNNNLTNIIQDIKQFEQELEHDYLK